MHPKMTLVNHADTASACKGHLHESHPEYTSCRVQSVLAEHTQMVLQSEQAEAWRSNHLAPSHLSSAEAAGPSSQAVL
jgi:hypothetical protein